MRTNSFDRTCRQNADVHAIKGVEKSCFSGATPSTLGRLTLQTKITYINMSNFKTVCFLTVEFLWCSRFNIKTIIYRKIKLLFGGRT